MNPGFDGFKLVNTITVNLSSGTFAIKLLKSRQLSTMLNGFVPVNRIEKPAKSLRTKTAVI